MKTLKLVLAALVSIYPVAGCSSAASEGTPTDTTSSSSGGRSSSGSSGSSGGLSSSSGGDDESPDATVGDDASSSSPIVYDGGSGLGPDGAACAPNKYPLTSWVPLAAPVLPAFSRTQSDMIAGPDAGAGTAPPSGWNYYDLSKNGDGAICRDGSPLGVYVKYGTVNKVMIYFEGGGLCFSSHFCDHNPSSMWQQFSADPQTEGQTIAGSLGNLASPAILQQPWSTGIFDQTNAANPFAGWSQVYIPYCTGDAHFGTIDQGSVSDYSGGVASPGTSSVNPGYHFVGFNNSKKIIGHLAATFAKPDQLVLTGASAGGLAAIFNAGMAQETFGDSVPMTVLLDSAAGFQDTTYMSACLQKEARTTYGWDNALPSDCADCRQADGSGLMNIVNYLHNRYPADKVGLLMSIHDQIFRLFFSAGQGTDPNQPQNCDSNDPNILAALGLSAVGGNPPRYPADLWAAGLTSLRDYYDCTSVFSSYFIGSQDPSASMDPTNTIDSLHMHSFRDRYYTTLSGSISPAQWTADLLSGKMEDIGP